MKCLDKSFIIISEAPSKLCMHIHVKHKPVLQQ